MKEKDWHDMRDDEIRILGTPSKPALHKRAIGRWWLWCIVVIVAILLSIVFVSIYINKSKNEPEQFVFEEVDLPSVPQMQRTPFGRIIDDDTGGFCEIKDTIINDIPLRIFIPHNADMSLHIGRINQEDNEIIYVAQAADVRADNGGIVGAFVLKGEPRAWGLSKRGYCASINGEITVGVADNSPLFEKATEESGYFFRQYPLVSNRNIVENEPKGKSIRRGICSRVGEIFMVETCTQESFHDFSQALVDLGVDNAVYLVGSSAHGWAIDESGERHEWGTLNTYKGRRKMPKNTSYIVWKKRDKDIEISQIKM